MYVQISSLDDFVEKVLDHLSTKVVVISGQWQNTPPARNDTIQRLLDNQYIMHWFCQNLPKYGGSNPYHPKISPFPYGLKEFGDRCPLAFTAY